MRRIGKRHAVAAVLALCAVALARVVGATRALIVPVDRLAGLSE